MIKIYFMILRFFYNITQEDSGVSGKKQNSSSSSIGFFRGKLYPPPSLEYHFYVEVDPPGFSVNFAMTPLIFIDILNGEG